MKEALTPKQQTLLDYLKQEIEPGGMAPSLRTAALALGISHAAVAQLLRALENKGYIRRKGRYSRTIQVLEAGADGAENLRRKEIPVIGSITAGLPMYAQEEWDGTVVVDAAIYPGEHLFALRIQGDSMKDAGILNQDLAICTPRQYAQNNEIVVALIRQEEATVKRFFLRSDHIELRPDNPAYSPRTYGFDEILIQGKVVGIVRGPDGMDQGGYGTDR